MTQSNESNLRGPVFFLEQRNKQNYLDCEKWAKKFQLTIIAKKSLNNEDLINLPIRPELIVVIPETS